jgi:hypothetical protein
MSLSACLIVRDEERFLDRCLASLRGHVDEICVLDTGSSDRSVEIARAHGAIVSHRPWDDDFSAARNASLELATGDWILQIDADEELVPPAPGAWSVLRDFSAFCALVELDLRGDEGRSERTWQPRLFRRDPRLRYRRPLHETVLDGLAEAGLPSPRPVPLLLIHHGYLGEVVSSRGKIERNLRILRTWRDRGAADSYDLFKLASALETLSVREGSRELDDVWTACLSKGFAAPPALRLEWPWWPRAVLAAIRHFQSAGRIQDALDACELLESIPGTNPDLATLHAEVLLASGRPAAALVRLGSSEAHQRLVGLCREALGDVDGAWREWSSSPGHDALKARLLARIGNVDQAVALLSGFFGATSRDPDSLGDAVEALLELGERSTAESLLGNSPSGTRRQEARLMRLRNRLAREPIQEPPLDATAAADALVRAILAGLDCRPLDAGFDRAFVRDRVADLLERMIERGEESSVRLFARLAPSWEGVVPGIGRLVEDAS